MNDSEYLLTINAPSALEESIVDCLLTFESEHGFSSTTINAHDHRNLGLSLAEQVTGRQQKIRFQMPVPETSLKSLLDRLKREFTGAGIHYWVSPIIESGWI